MVQLFSRGLFLASVGLTALAACATDSEPLRNDGVNDVRQACEIRKTWTKAASEKCLNCQIAAPEPGCACEAFIEFGALCEVQGTARKAEPGCTSALDDCTRACVKTDCGCLEGCYANAARCKQRSAARDGCVTAVCSQYCR